MPGIPVPIYQEKFGPVSPVSVRQRLTAAPFEQAGAELGRGVTQFVGAGASILIQERTDAAQSALMKGYNDAAIARMEMEDAFKQLKGTDATEERAAEITKQYQDKMRLIEQGNGKDQLSLPPMVLGRWKDQIAPQQMSALQESMRNHLTAQMDKVAQDTADGVVKTSSLEATRFAGQGDLQKMHLAMLPGLHAIEVEANRQGLPKQKIEVLQSAFLTKTNSDAVGSLIDNKNISAARSEIERLRKDPRIDQGMVDDLVKRLGDTEVETWAMNTAATAQSNFTAKDGYSFDLAAAEKWALQQANARETINADTGEVTPAGGGTDAAKKLKALRGLIQEQAAVVERNRAMHDSPLVDTGASMIYQSKSLDRTETSSEFRKLYDAASWAGKRDLDQLLASERERRRAKTGDNIDNYIINEFHALPPDEKLAVSRGEREFPLRAKLTLDGHGRFDKAKRETVNDGGVTNEKFTSYVKSHTPTDFSAEEAKDFQGAMFYLRDQYRAANPDKNLPEESLEWVADAIRLVDQGWGPFHWGSKYGYEQINEQRRKGDIPTPVPARPQAGPMPVPTKVARRQINGVWYTHHPEVQENGGWVAEGAK